MVILEFILKKNEEWIMYIDKEFNMCKNKILDFEIELNFLWRKVFVMELYYEEVRKELDDVREELWGV